MKYSKYKFLVLLVCIFLVTVNICIVSSKTVEYEAKNNNGINTYDYHSYQEMTDLLIDLYKDNSDIMKLQSLAFSYENRDIWLVKLSDNVEIDEKEPSILLMGAHHGNEKISFELLIYFIKYVVETYRLDNFDNDNDNEINEDPIDGKDNDLDGEIDEDPSEERLRNAVNNTEIYIIPMVNPDGVEANSRKNCNPNRVYGVNINRNYGYDWYLYDLFPTIYGDSYTSEELNPNYRGPFGYSENETKAVKNFVESTSIDISISYHSGAEVIFYPWYHTTAKTPHENLFISIGEDISEINGYPLWTGSSPIIPRLGGTLGTSENFLYGKHSIIAYTLEAHRSFAPSNPSTVNRVSIAHTGVHLYLCERAQTINNKKNFTRDLITPFPHVLYLLHKICPQLC